MFAYFSDITLCPDHWLRQKFLDEEKSNVVVKCGTRNILLGSECLHHAHLCSTPHVMAWNQDDQLVLILKKVPFQKKWKTISFAEHIHIPTRFTEAIQYATGLRPLDPESFMTSCPARMKQVTWSKAKDYLNSVEKTLKVELSEWLNIFPMDYSEETDATRSVGCSSSDFPQIVCPDMPLDDLYVAQYIATAESNMKKQKDEDLEEIRQRVQFLCDVCILVYDGKSVSKAVAIEKNLEAKYHNPVLKMNLCSDCFKVASEEEKQNFCVLSIASCQTEDDTEEYMTFLQDLTSRLGIDTSS